MTRPRGLSARWKLTLSYAALVIIAGTALLAVVVFYLLRYVPDHNIESFTGFVPNRSDLLREFQPRVSLMFVLLVAFGLVGGWILAGRMLRPLHRISDAARLAAEGSLSHRISMVGPSDEFRDLADVFDSMLDRLETQVAEQQRFAANASHELRTPLAISQTLLDVARADPDRDVDALIAQLDAVNRRSIELTEALLLLSKAENRAFMPHRVDLALAAENAVEHLAPLADRNHVELEVDAEPAVVFGSDALLHQLAMNLVHNAIMHNLAESGWVTVRTSTTQDAAVLTVENTGAAIGAELISTLTEPFHRGNARTRASSADTDHVGAGLGLAIAQRVVDAHGGQLDLTPRPECGLRVTVTIPFTIAVPLVTNSHECESCVTVDPQIPPFVRKKG